MFCVFVLPNILFSTSALYYPAALLLRIRKFNDKLFFQKKWLIQKNCRLSNLDGLHCKIWVKLVN